MAGTIIADVIQSDQSYPSSINIASPVIISNTFAFPAGTVSAPAFFPTGDTNTGIFFPAADTIAFAEGGAEAMRIDSDGDVGIGDSAPSHKLTVSGTQNTVGSEIRVRAVGVESGYLGANSDGFNIGVDNYSIIFKTNVTGTGSVGATGTERMRIDSSGNLLFNSGYGSVATAYGCRAWVNFDGTGTPSIREDGNVSSITDNGTGDYTVNFATAMPDANYAMNLSTGPDAGGTYGGTQISIFSQTNSPFKQAPTTTTARFINRDASFSFKDSEYCCVAIFR